MAIRVGYFPHNNSLFVLRHRGILEQKLDVEWVDLRALPEPPETDPTKGLPSLHSDWLFNEGGYDFIGTGFTPPITALAEGRDIVDVGISGPRVENGRLVVKADSNIRSVKELAGKRVGIAHGSWQTTLLLFALDNVGLTWSDVVPVNTSVTDGADDFRTGKIDAWEAALRGRPFGINPVDDTFLDEQQRAADLLFANGLLPQAVIVRDAVLEQRV